MSWTNDLRFYKLFSGVKDPKRATEGSACFDLYSFLPDNSAVSVYINHIDELEIKIDWCKIKGYKSILKKEF